MTLRQALIVLWRQRLLIIAAVIVAVLAAGGYLYTRSSSYTADATVQLAQPSQQDTQQQPAPTVGGPSLQLITGDRVVAAAARTLKTTNPATLRGQVSSTYDSTTGVVTITASSAGAKRSVRVANAFATAYVGALGHRAVQQLQALQAQAGKLNSRITALTARNQGQPRNNNVLQTQITAVTALYSTIQSQILQAQIAPASASLLHAATGAAATGISKYRLLLLAAAIGLLAGAGLALLRSQFDTKVRTVEGAEAICGRPVLSELPYVRAYRRSSVDLPVVDAPRTPYAESIRELRTSLSVLLDGAQTPVLVVTSPAPFDGKTLATANLAASLALSGKRTVVVSGDLRKPRMHEFFGGQERAEGVAELLDGHSPSAGRTIELVRRTEIDGLSILPAGHPQGDPADGLASKSMGSMLDALRTMCDVVIIDSPPVLAVADAAIIGAHADGMLIVVRANKTAEKELAETVKRLQASQVHVLGVALNRVRGVVGSVYGEYYRAAGRQEPAPDTGVGRGAVHAAESERQLRAADPIPDGPHAEHVEVGPAENARRLA